MYKKYFDLVCQKIQTIKNDEGEQIQRAAHLVADTIMQGKLVYTFGSGHSQLLAMEVHGRAGGLYPVIEINDPLRGKAEKIEGIGHVLMEGSRIGKGDLLFNISNSGRNPEGIEIAIDAKAAGATVIVVTSLEHSKSIKSRHSGGKNLYEYGDLVLDTQVPAGDSAMAYEGSPIKAGALSTVLGSAIMNAVMVQAVQYMLDAGYEPPVLMSANVDNSEQHNNTIVERYKNIGYMLDL
ncbi:MAG: SIS domain-containing protein [Anaerolineaceae bacterium]|nr:SIS domain-containing protein [Anaerolineaceae bacterium]